MIFQMYHIVYVEWLVEYTEEFEVWWDTLTADVQERINDSVRLLEERGPKLGRPFADVVRGSKHPNMKELRVQHAGEPYRILFAFDPRRCAILLIGGRKTGRERWYEEYIPIADRIFDAHLRKIEQEEWGAKENDGQKL